MRNYVVKMLVIVASFTAISAVTAAAENDSRINKAKEIFAQYINLEHAFDSACADLYSDEAIIRNKRTYPNGQVRELTLPAPKYKELIRSSMSLAKLRGDTSSYSNVSYALEGEGVRIKAERYSNLKKYKSPISIMVKPSGSGMWLIYEEISESQP